MSALAIYGSVYFLNQDIHESNTLISPISHTVLASTDTHPSAASSSSLQDVIPPVLAGKSGTYGVVVENLTNGEKFSYNESQSFYSASLYKLWVMATAFSEIEKGRLQLDQTLSAKIADLDQKNNLTPDTSDNETDDTSITLTVQQALSRMITVSDNYAAYLLVDKIGITSIQTLMKANGLSSSIFLSPPRTTPKDIAHFYDLLYAKKLVSKDASEQMLILLRQQQLNDRIPKYLPDMTVIAHKTGELDGFKHDAGIVYTGAGAYLIVLMSNTNNPVIAAETEAQVSQAVYDYFDAERNQAMSHNNAALSER